MTIFDYAQFINWRLVDRQRPDGSITQTKVPWSFVSNWEIDPTNPGNHMTFDQARASGHPVGFVFTERDPYFFLDLDKCRVGNGWTAEAGEICRYFAGAAREVSQSGNGIHIVARCNKAVLADRKHKWAGWLEFYTTKRFMALGPWGFEGDFDAHDWTNHLLAFVPRRDPTDQVELTAGPVANYTGPADDDELIAKARASLGGIGQVFGSKATFDHLWTGRADVLCQHYPSSSGDVYDRSSADAALFAHLAFWTGKDAARMDRLFRRSALMRDKYRDRETYRNDTISKAIAACQKVYDYVRPSSLPTPGPGAAETGSGDGWLTIPEQQEYFKGCVYVLSDHKILTPLGVLMKPEQFNAYYGGKRFIMSADGGESTKKAWEAFTENRAHQFPKVQGLCFRPKAAPGAIIDNRVNIYRPHSPERKAGDPGPFLRHLERMMPHASDRATLLAYMASLVQNPGVKFQWAPVIQGAEGNGKTILTLCLEYAVGHQYSHRPSAEDLANPFNAYIENKLLIVVEEVHLQGRRELLDTLKPLITNDRVETQPKGVDKRMVENWANWMFLTNHRDAIVKSINDRRYAIFFTAQQDAAGIVRDGMGGDYFPQLYAWLRADGFSIVTDFLLSYQIPVELDPAKTVHRAPATTSTPLAIEQSLGRIEQEIMEAIASGDEGFRNGWISSWKVEVLCRENRLSVSRMRMSEIIQSLGYLFVERARRPLMKEDLKRPTLYVRADQYRADLETADYCIAQGYPEHFRASIMPYPPQAANSR